jgi:hypothetical protein
MSLSEPVGEATVEQGGSDDDDDDDDDEEVSQATVDIPEDERKMPAKKRKKPSTGKGRGRPPGSANKKGKPEKEKEKVPRQRHKFTDTEDINICMAWKNVTLSPITGANQTGPVFWGKIVEAYHELIDKVPHPEGKPHPRRNILSLTDRFQRNIQKDTTKFNASFIQRKRLNESGKTLQDLINDACEDYKIKQEGKHYRFVHCLEVLWTCPLFSVEETAQAERPSSRASSRARASSLDGDRIEDEDIVFDDVEEDPAIDETKVNNVASRMQGAHLVRPKGNKAAKMQRQVAQRREHWNKKRHDQMKKLTKATEQATKMLKFSTIQNAIAARVGHYIMLGQNQTALALLRQSEGTLDFPDDENQEVDNDEVDDDEENESDEEEETKEETNETNDEETKDETGDYETPAKRAAV